MKLSTILWRYRAAIAAAVVLLAFMLAYPALAPKASATLLDQLRTVFLVVPPSSSSSDSSTCGFSGRN
jgi:hypothetical protein